jgi:hypothetical protein
MRRLWWWVALSGSLAILHGAGKGTLAVSSPRDVELLARGDGVAVAAVAVVRLGLLAVGAYLGVLGVLGEAARLPGARRVLVPLLRLPWPGGSSLVWRSIGAVWLVGGLATGAVASAAPVTSSPAAATTGLPPGGVWAGVASPVMHLLPGGTAVGSRGDAGAPPTILQAPALQPPIAPSPTPAAPPSTAAPAMTVAPATTATTAPTPPPATAIPAATAPPTTAAPAATAPPAPAATPAVTAAPPTTVTPAAPATTSPAGTPVPGAAPARVATSTWVLQRGESLWSVAESTVAAATGGHPDPEMVGRYWAEVVAANRDRLPVPAEPDYVLPGFVVVLPALAFG